MKNKNVDIYVNAHEITDNNKSTLYLSYTVFVQYIFSAYYTCKKKLSWCNKNVDIYFNAHDITDNNMSTLYL